MQSLFDEELFNQRLFFPREEVTPTPAGARELEVFVAPGVQLHVRVHDAPGASAAVLLFHGNGEVVANYDAAATLFHRMGATLAVMDYRGYGRSTGKPTLRSVLGDVPLVVSTVQAALGKDGALPLVVMGRSLGGMCAAEAARACVDGIAGFIFESAPASLSALVQRRGYDPPESFSHDELQDFEPLRKLRSVQCPVLVLHGAEDRMINPSEARVWFEAIPHENRRLVLVPERGHNDLLRSPVYWEALAAFLLQVRT